MQELNPIEFEFAPNDDYCEDLVVNTEQVIIERDSDGVLRNCLVQLEELDPEFVRQKWEELFGSRDSANIDEPSYDDYLNSFGSQYFPED